MKPRAKITVERLIKELKKYPKEGLVAWRDHDQSQGEINSVVGSIKAFDPAASFDPEFCAGVLVVLSTA
jgi:hypothetical protein